MALDDYGIIKRLIELKNNKQWSYYRIAKESHLPESTVANVYKQKSLPQIDTLYSLCKGFNITLAQFFSEDEKYAQLSDSEKEMLKQWNNLTNDNQKFVKEFIEKLNKR